MWRTYINLWRRTTSISVRRIRAWSTIGMPQKCAPKWISSIEITSLLSLLGPKSQANFPLAAKKSSRGLAWRIVNFLTKFRGRRSRSASSAKANDLSLSRRRVSNRRSVRNSPAIFSRISKILAVASTIVCMEVKSAVRQERIRIRLAGLTWNPRACITREVFATWTTSRCNCQVWWSRVVALAWTFPRSRCPIRPWPRTWSGEVGTFQGTTIKDLTVVRPSFQSRLENKPPMPPI